MAKYESILKFKKYVVDEIKFKRNHNYQNKENKPIKVDFEVRESKKINENELIINLYTKVFGNAEIKNYPFEIEVTITGFFDISENKGNIDFEPNAIAILYPYIRAIISTYTSSANVAPVILPAINVNAMLKQQKENKKEN